MQRRHFARQKPYPVCSLLCGPISVDGFEQMAAEMVCPVEGVAGGAGRLDGGGEGCSSGHACSPSCSGHFRR